MIEASSPGPQCLPLALASCMARARAREWIFWGFLMTKPSLISLRILSPAPARCQHPALLASRKLAVLLSR